MNFVAARADGPELIGIGLYTAPEAGKLIGVPVARIRRWLLGYAYHRDGERHWSSPLWQPQVPRLGKEVELGFRDLLELRFVDAFTKTGLSLRAIRKALDVAREVTETDHPFATARFRTDGRSIFLRVAGELADEVEPVLIDLLKQQYALNRIVEPSLKDLDFDDGGFASRWWPTGRAKPIVLDPAHAFGRPIIAGVGVTTRALADAAVAEGTVERVARMYEVPVAAVRDAIAFERRLAA
jgi:uncharacterized protein (DUF433 family)/DNA-binding transcriptional MerR regulator